ncbi:hypothetical protein GCM10027275_18690 [Rhabdobacter roseus]|uniref:histidine kinase n=1 Tax=Rhabdobacter roseus TaxID=1655419 RepID=A0A840TK50_9BACT|nr:PAS domain S-box protein [Rhabdobacter roseus]MBB5283794.1 PAS domain S-box-containing protein [Rhabdobacter roseus]
MPYSIQDPATANERFKLLAKATHDSIWDWNLLTNQVWWNEGFGTMFGYRPEDIGTGPESWTDRIHPEDQERVLCSIHAVIEQGSTNWSEHYRFRRADGTYAYILDRGYTIQENQQPVRMVGSMMDVTELVELRKERAESELRTQLALQAAGMGAWSVFPLENRVILDAHCQKIFNWPSPEVPLDEVLSCIHPDDAPLILRALRSTFRPRQSTPAIIDYRHIGPLDKKTKWIRLNGSVYFNEQGVADHFTGTVRDISEEKRKDEALRNIERRFQTAFDNAAMGIAISALSGKIILVNKALFTITGFTQEELYNENYETITHPDDIVRNREILDTLREGKASSCQFNKRYIRKDGKVIWVSLNVTLIRGVEGEPDSFFSIIQDITDEIQLREEQRKLLVLVENSVDLMSILELDGRNSYLNRSGMDLLGFEDKEQVLTTPISELHTPEDHAFVEENVLPTTLRTGRWSGRMVVRHRQSGERIPVFNNCLRIDDSLTGQPIAVGAIMRDLRPDIASQQELEKSEKNFRAMIEQAPMAIGLLRGKDLVVESANQLILEVWGKTVDIIGLPIREALPEILGQGFVELLEGVYHTGASHFGYETMARLYRNGQMEDGYFNYVYAPVREADGTVSGIMVVATEVTQQIQARKDLLESEHRFKLLMEAIAQMTWTSTPEGEVDFYNQRWYSYTGLTFEETKAWGWQAVVHPDDLPHTLAMYQKSLASGDLFLVENRYRRADGEYRWHLNSALPLRDEQGTITMWVGTATDIHNQKQVEAELEKRVAERTEELRKLNISLQQSNQELEQYAYVASHDLQEPLRKIRIFSNLLYDLPTLPDEVKNKLSKVINSSERMTLLIQGLLEYSRLLKSETQTVSTNLSQILKNVITDFELAIEEKQAQLNIEELPTLEAIPLQMNQLFYNLLSNSLKFIQKDVKPYISIRARLLSPQDLQQYKLAQTDRSYYEITFSDNGIGFDSQYSQQIFEVFKRLHTRQVYPGSGIGLALCRKIVQNHQGLLLVESELGKGTVFRIVLPGQQADL